jgi:hypothetical protein
MTFRLLPSERQARALVTLSMTFCAGAVVLAMVVNNLARSAADIITVGANPDEAHFSKLLRGLDRAEDALAVVASQVEAMRPLFRDQNPVLPAPPFVDDKVCEPACSGKECGDDGCGGDCGSCQPELECSANRCVRMLDSLAGTYDFVDVFMQGQPSPFVGTLHVTRRDTDEYATYAVGFSPSLGVPIYYAGWWKREGDHWRVKTTNTNEISSLGVEATSRISLAGAKLSITNDDGSRFVLQKRP